MPEWNIQSRAHQCQNCSSAFKDRQHYHTTLMENAQGFERRDFCERCWNERDKELIPVSKFISHWQGVYEAPPAAAPDAIQKDTAESLLRKLVERREERYLAASYILAVMLERKRILKVKSQLREGPRRIFVYEHGASGDIFTISDPDLQLDQLEKVQHEVSSLLEHGLPGEAPPAPAEQTLPLITENEPTPESVPTADPNTELPTHSSETAPTIPPA
jgi:hypothetical protein